MEGEAKVQVTTTLQVTTTNTSRLCGCALLMLACGCHASAHPPVVKTARCVCSPGGPGAGYFSTCWRQWPSECTSCPPRIEPGQVVPESLSPAEVLPPAATDAPEELPSAGADGPRLKQINFRGSQRASGPVRADRQPSAAQQTATAPGPSVKTVTCGPEMPCGAEVKFHQNGPSKPFE